MNQRQKDRVKKFIAALRSGEYQQGDSQLHLYNLNNQPDKFCCLGVACVVALKNRVRLNVSRGYSSIQYDGQYGYLPEKLIKYYGFKDNDPMLVDTDGTEITATKANDALNYDFNKIANLFERTYLSEE